MRHKNTADDFWSNVQRCEGDGCWTWLGELHKGYGTFHLNGQSMNAHRAAFILGGGVVKPRQHVHHICTRKDCVRPDHLEALTPQQHMAKHAGARRNTYRWQLLLIRRETAALPASSFGVIGFRAQDDAYKAASFWQTIHPDHTRIVVSHYAVDDTGNRLPATPARRLRISSAA